MEAEEQAQQDCRGAESGQPQLYDVDDDEEEEEEKVLGKVEGVVVDCTKHY